MKKFFAMLLSFILCGTALAFAACADNTPSENISSGDPASDTLVVYFSWSGNTREMASYIAGQTDAYLVEIVPEEPYEGSYNDVAYGRAQEEAENNARPAVSQATYDLIDMENYDTILIGFPIW